MVKGLTASLLAFALSGCVALNDAFDVNGSATAGSSVASDGATASSDSAGPTGGTNDTSGDGSASTASDATTKSSAQDDTAAESGFEDTTSGDISTTSGIGSDTGAEADVGDPTRSAEPVKMLWLTDNVSGDFGGPDYVGETAALCEDALEDSISEAMCESTSVALLGSSLGNFDAIPAFVPGAGFLVDDSPFVAASTGLPIVGGWEQLAAGAIAPGFLPDLLLPYGKQNDAFFDYWIGPRAKQPLGPSCENWTTTSIGVFGQRLRVTSDEDSFAIATECDVEHRVLCACIGIPAGA
ncbi:MAG: hypothetical protein AAGA54_23265 [Myxococcota bacterium]